MKNFFKKILNLLGLDIKRFNPNLFGLNPMHDLKKLMNTKSPIIFDVGANKGQSIKIFYTLFPKCKIHAFEPSKETFQELSKKFKKSDKLNLWNIGFGASEKRLSFFENSCSDMSSFLKPSTEAWGEIIKESELDIHTLYSFCHKNNIDKIDLLKIDTQGYDLEVLKGASQILKRGKVRLVFIELIFSDMYTGMPQVGEIFNFLYEMNFSLVTIYPLHYRNGLASFTDALFMHKS